ncbi:MAG TPA: hypothetical protein VFM09_00505 [Marmoricola sp.]|nr:hypothetical protein [Marmoricola sp.]
MATSGSGVRLYGALALMVPLCVVVFWILGFLPWVLGGFTLPVAQAHGAGAGLAGVRLAVPLVATRLPELVASTLVGAVLAGMVPIAFPRVPRLLAVVVAGSVVLATTTAVLVSSRASLEHWASVQFAADHRVVEGLVLAMVCASALGLAVGLTATVRHGVVAVAAGVVAAALPAWVAAFPGVEVGLLTEVVAAAALLVGLLVSVHRTRWSAAWWPAALALGWLGAPLAAAAAAVATRLQPGSDASLSELVGRAGHAVAGTSGPVGQAWWPWAVVAAVALARLVRPSAGHRRADAGSTVDGAHGEPRQELHALAPERPKHAATRRA